MRDGRWQAAIICPFFRELTLNAVKCEGPIDNTSVKLQFADRAAVKTQLRVFCWDHYKNCEIYRMVMDARYEEEE